VGFHLKPYGFFARNPALDVPPRVNKASKKCCESNGAATATNGAATNGAATNGCH
jgi:hypothetical protein